MKAVFICIHFCSVLFSTYTLKLPSQDVPQSDKKHAPIGGFDSEMLPNDTFVHDMYLYNEKHEAIFAKHKTVTSMFKVGREGSNKCLSFLHIPKNAGSTIEEESQHIVTSTHQSVRHWGKFDSSLKCSKNSCEFEYHKNGKHGKGLCSRWHVPPNMDNTLANSYSSDGCETFCIVRSPSTKFASQLKYAGGTKHCSEEWFYQSALQNVQRTQSYPYQSDCHYVSQTEYIFGNSDKPQFCSHQLRFENLKQDFDNLMAEFDIPVSLSRHANKVNCQVSIEKTSAGRVIHDFVKEYYVDDLQNFKYSL